MDNNKNPVLRQRKYHVNIFKKDASSCSEGSEKLEYNRLILNPIDPVIKNNEKY
jgi:hypothetical protein